MCADFRRRPTDGETEIMMKTALTAAAVLLGVSTLAVAQTSPTAPSTRPATPAPSGTTTSPGTGASGSGSPSISSEQIKSALEQQGYSQVQVKPSSGGHSVTAMKDGKQVKMEVDSSGRATLAR
jgi:hypothetical protein